MISRRVANVAVGGCLLGACLGDIGSQGDGEALGGAAGAGLTGQAGAGALGGEGGFGSMGGGAATGGGGAGAGGLGGTGGAGAGTGGVINTGGAGGSGGSTCGDPGDLGDYALGGGGPSCSFPQGVPDEDFIASACSYGDTDPVVDQAVVDVMVALTGCSPGSDCPIVGFPGGTIDEQCQSFFAAVTAELRAQGFCAGQHAVGATDEIAVANMGCTGKWYGYHVCFYGGPKVVWIPGAKRGWWAIAPQYCP